MQHSHDARHLSQNILSSCFHRHSVVTACIFTTHWVVKIIQLTDFPNFTFTCQSIDFIVSRERNIFILQPCTLTFDLDLRTWPRYGRLPDQQGYRRHQTSPPPRCRHLANWSKHNEHQKNWLRSRIEFTPTALLRYHAHTRWTLTFDLDLWPWLSIPDELWSWPLHTETQLQRSVYSKDRVETNGQTDGQSDATVCFIYPANAVAKNRLWRALTRSVSGQMLSPIISKHDVIHKTEVHKVFHCRQRKIEPRPQYCSRRVSVCLFVCLSVCPLTYFKNRLSRHTAKYRKLYLSRPNNLILG